MKYHDNSLKAGWQTTRRVVTAAVCVVALAALSCGCSDGADTQPRAGDPPAGALGPELRDRADRLVSLFENSTPALRYDYVAPIDDGRGITAGRAGFTSATGDLALVVRRYLQGHPDSDLARFLPTLEDLAAAGSDDITGLTGFATAWRVAAADPDLRAVQDAVVDELYFAPAMAIAESLGVTQPLTRVALYDAAIQHGVGDDPDGLPALVAETVTRVGSAAEDEAAWLGTFLRIRRSHLTHAADPATREAWRSSTGRVDTFEALLEARNLAFNPTHVTVYGDDFDLS
jgi:chitosanase